MFNLTLPFGNVLLKVAFAETLCLVTAVHVSLFLIVELFWSVPRQTEEGADEGHELFLLI